MIAKLSLMYSVEVMKTNVFQNHPSSPLFFCYCVRNGTFSVRTEPLVTVIKHPTQAWCLEEERDELLRKMAVCL